MSAHHIRASSAAQGKCAAMCSASRQPKRAFTLVELLVVIGIIAVLIAILLPVLGKAKEEANPVDRESIVRRQGTYTGVYLDDNRQFYPFPGVNVRDAEWDYV